MKKILIVTASLALSAVPAKAASPPKVSQFAYEHFAGCMADFEGFTMLYERRMADIEGGVDAPDGERDRLGKLLEARRAGFELLRKYSRLVHSPMFEAKLDHEVADSVYDDIRESWRKVIETTPSEREDWLRDNQQSILAAFEDGCRDRVNDFIDAIDANLMSRTSTGK